MAVDFRVLFQSNAALIIGEMRQLEAQALRTQAVINQTAAASARTAAAARGVGAGGAVAGPAALGGLTPVAVGAVSPKVAQLTAQLGNLQYQMRAVSAVGLAPTLGQMRRELTLLQQITAAGGPSFGRFNSNVSAAAASLSSLNPAARQSAQELIAQRAALDNTGAAFQRHVGRIQETILVYAAFTAAAAGAVSAVSLATTIDTESRRLEAVLGVGPEQGGQFISGLFDTAVSTATPIEELLAEADFAASAFSDLTDAQDRTAASQELLNRVGQVTTVTQRDVATETQNLIAIMRLGGLTVEDLGTQLGGVIVAGNNSSAAIRAILDALRISLPGAKLAGVTIEQLIALTGLFRQETQRSGQEIGSTFATLFQTITQPEAEKNLSEITGGLVELRDEAGNLRPALEVLVQINALIAEGAIEQSKLRDIAKVLAPPLNPAAAKDIALLIDLIGQLPPALNEVEQAGAGALDELVNQLNQALGPQFRILIEDIKRGFFELFGQDIINAGQTLIDVVRAIGGILGSLPPELVRTIGAFIALAGAIKGVTFVAGALFSLMGGSGLIAAFKGTAGAAVAAGGAMATFGGAAAGLLAVASRLLPILAAIMAIDFASGVLSQQEGLRTQIGGLTEGMGPQELAALRARLEQQKEGEGLDAPIESALKTFTTNPVLDEGIAEIDRLLAILKERGAGATVTLDDLGGQFQDTAEDSQTIEEAMATQAAELERLMQGYMDGANASSEFSEAQRIEAETATLMEATRKNQADDLIELGERLREGKISAEEFAQGQQIVAQAAELAAQLVAAGGDVLAEYPLLADAAAQGNEALTERIYDLIVASGGSIGPLSQMISQIVALATANAAAAESMRNNPIIAYIGTARFSADGSRAAISTPGGGRRIVRGSTVRRAQQQQEDFQGSSAADVERQLQALIDGVLNTLGGAGSGSAAFGNLPRPTSSGGSASRAAARPSVDIFDLGDFDEKKLGAALRLARSLQAAIPGGNAAAKGDIFSVIADAQFIKNVKDLDQELLRKAIERLTDIEEARLALEKQRTPLLQNLQVNQGPLSSLISQPVTFGAGGSFLGGTGFNSNPATAGVTINIGNISSGNLTSAQIYQMIYAAISKAMSEAART